MKKGDIVQTTAWLGLTSKDEYMQGEIHQIIHQKCLDASVFEKIYVKFEDGRILPCIREELTVIDITDEQNADFLSDLNKFNKDELVDLIYDFWTTLKKEAIRRRNDDFTYMAKESGNIQITQVNRLRNLASYKLKNQ